MDIYGDRQLTHFCENKAIAILIKLCLLHSQLNELRLKSEYWQF